MDQRGQHAATDHELERHKAREAEIGEQPDRRPHVHRPRLHPPFEPARALAQPRAETRRRFLVGGRAHDRRAIAEAREPDAEIGVLGDVVRIPGAGCPQRRGAEMIRRAAKRQREFKRGEAGEKQVKLCGIFRGEQAGEPVVRGVVDGEAGLDTSKVFASAEEDIERATELIGLRPVFGVVDGREGATRKRQRPVKRLRLGARSARRRGDDLERYAEIEARQRNSSLQVVGFRGEFNVEFLGWVIEFAQCRDQALDRRSLAVERDDDGVDRQSAVGEANRPHDRRGQERAGQPQQQPGEKSNREACFDSPSWFRPGTRRVRRATRSRSRQAQPAAASAAARPRTAAIAPAARWWHALANVSPPCRVMKRLSSPVVVTRIRRASRGLLAMSCVSVRAARLRGATTHARSLPRLSGRSPTSAASISRKSLSGQASRGTSSRVVSCVIPSQDASAAR